MLTYKSCKLDPFNFIGMTHNRQVKSNSSVQLFLEVYCYQKIASHIYRRNIACSHKIFTFLKLLEFDQFYNKNFVAYLLLSTFKYWKVLQNFWYRLLKIYSCDLLVSTTNRISLSVSKTNAVVA